jgi:hypothetical protein
MRLSGYSLTGSQTVKPLRREWLRGGGSRHFNNVGCDGPMWIAEIKPAPKGGLRETVTLRDFSVSRPA